jgi:hypothetical protein
MGVEEMAQVEQGFAEQSPSLQAQGDQRLPDAAVAVDVADGEAA